MRAGRGGLGEGEGCDCTGRTDELVSEAVNGAVCMVPVLRHPQTEAIAEEPLALATHTKPQRDGPLIGRQRIATPDPAALALEY